MRPSSPLCTLAHQPFGRPAAARPAAAALAAIVLLGGSLAIAAKHKPVERIPFDVPFEQRGFEQIAHEHGVRVYKHKSSDIIHLAAEGRFWAGPKAVRDVVLNYERQLGRVGRLSESKVLSRDEGSLVVYQRLNLPVISDRDFVLRVRSGKDGDIYWVSYQAVSGVGPGPRDGVVRVTHHSGNWQFKPNPKGKGTLARFHATIDLGGWLPKWLARSGSGEEVPKVFMAFDGILRENLRKARKAHQAKGEKK